MNKTLYVSDLDGTLLLSNQTISDFTASTLNRLIGGGMNFTYATARSLSTASVVTHSIECAMPAIVYNGCFIVESATKKLTSSVFFAALDARGILNSLVTREVYPIIYSHNGVAEKFSYIAPKINAATREFTQSRKGDFRDNPVGSARELYSDGIFYFSCVDKSEKLLPLYNKYKHRFYCVYQKDIYSGEQWLEIMPREASKAQAILRLKNILGCDLIVSFGDSKNDIPMFEISDECYAVGNALDELKAIATGVIESNESDGVARWLNENVKL